MAAPKSPPQEASGRTFDNIAYLRQMLSELRSVAEAEGCDMLCYLLEMAYLEASEIQMGRRPLSLKKG